MINPTIAYIIDDDWDDQGFLIDALKSIFPLIECYTASNGQDGLKKLKDAAIPTPSLIFMDLNMPRINGRKLLFQMKADPELKDIPVIIYTTSSNQKDQQELTELGATDYLVKQTEETALKAALQKILSFV